MRDGGSFRDPSGRVYVQRTQVYRSVLPPGKDNYEYVRATGLLPRLSEEGLVIAGHEVGPDVLAAIETPSPPPCYVLSHPRLDFISYPYEWPFEALRAAALLQLDIHLAALDAGVTLSDASAYNVQFRGPRPTFIDYLSFRRYHPGDYWTGYRQFCEQYLNPLLLAAYVGIPYHSWYRGSLEGLSASSIAPLLPVRRKMSLRVLLHVVTQAQLHGADTTARARKVSTRPFPLAGFQHMLRSLRRWIAGLSPQSRSGSHWVTYAQDNSYTSDDVSRKRDFVRRFVSAHSPPRLLDVGCNTGEYAQLALTAGARTVVGLESDFDALDAAFARAVQHNLNFLPLHQDLANPSPDQGWNGKERTALRTRCDMDAVLALAVLHHIVIGRNVPLSDAIAWFMTLGRDGVMEFVPKSDPMVRQLLALREDIFADYTEEKFHSLVGQHARIIETLTLDSGRVLVWYERS